MAGSELLRRLQGPKSGPHGVTHICGPYRLNSGGHMQIYISNALRYSTSKLCDSRICAPHSVALEVILSFTQFCSRLRHGYRGPWSTS
jgi:hypothetical protein